MKIIGVTGGIGAGKSQILDYMKEKHGAVICQADLVAKELQKKGTACFQAIVDHFGEEILGKDGELDRPKLASLVFEDKDELGELNEIVHPAVKLAIKELIQEEQKKGCKLFLIEGAVLIEDNYEEICDELWYIYVTEANRKKRLIFSRGYSEHKVEQIFSAQLPKRIFLQNCDRVIDNNGVFAETMIQLDDIMKHMDLSEK